MVATIYAASCDAIVFSIAYTGALTISVTLSITIPRLVTSSTASLFTITIETPVMIVDKWSHLKKGKQPIGK
jgi:hypothetical protein